MQAQTLDVLWNMAVTQVTNEGKDKPARDGEMREIQGATMRLLDVNNNWLYNATRNANPAYGAGELFWYLSGSDKGSHMEAYVKGYSRFLENGVAHGAYGKRWSDLNQLDTAYEIIRSKPHSQQNVITCWNPGLGYDDLDWAMNGGVADIPCTLSLQFIVEGDRLNCIGTMRSNDLWLGMPYDVYCFTTIQKVLADACGLKYGWYQHNVGSLHLYDRNQVAASMAARNPGINSSTYATNFEPKVEQKLGVEEFFGEAALAPYLKQEEFLRTDGRWSITGFDMDLRTPLSCALANVARRFDSLHEYDLNKMGNPYQLEMVR